MMSIHFTRGRSLTISSLTGKYSPQRTGFPRSFFFSKTLTFNPFFDRYTAEERPPGPPPTRITSYLLPVKQVNQLLVGDRSTRLRDLCIWQIRSGRS